MTGRRDFLIGAACVGGAAAALALEPRRRVSLLGGRRLSQIVPAAFAGWNSRDVSDLVAPAPEGSLQARLYGQTVERLYQNAADGAEVMVLIAYGDSQTNDLQLHRPEVCYPAFGFEIVGSRDLSLPLAGGVNLPSRALAAAAPNRRETIVYWTRLGAYLPTSVAQQRVDRLRTSMSGVISDGVLARCSCLDPDFASAVASLEAFVAGMVLATPAAERAVLIGEARARALTARGA
jgi:EpsI family protein